MYVVGVVIAILQRLGDSGFDGSDNKDGNSVHSVGSRRVCHVVWSVALDTLDFDWNCFFFCLFSVVSLCVRGGLMCSFGLFSVNNVA